MTLHLRELLAAAQIAFATHSQVTVLTEQRTALGTLETSVVPGIQDEALSKFDVVCACGQAFNATPRLSITALGAGSASLAGGEPQE